MTLGSVEMCSAERKIAMTLDLQKIRERLLAKQAELQGDVSGLTQAQALDVDPSDASQGVGDFEDWAVDENTLVDTQSVERNEQGLLADVRTALKRLDEGTYGTCIVCGEPIPEKRLEAIPWALRCIKDEEQLEQRNLSQNDLYDVDNDNGPDF